MKKRISCFLCSLLSLALLPISALAAAPTAPAQATTFAVGGANSAVIDSSGQLWIWGGNQDGELGNGKTGNDVVMGATVEPKQTVPAVLFGDASAVSIGLGYAAAIKSDGSLWMWGNNRYGQLGNGTTSGDAKSSTYLDPSGTLQTVPMKATISQVAAVSLGDEHSAAILTDGSLWTWGSNAYGQLGNGTTQISAVPVKIMDGVAAVGAGQDHTAALKRDGSLWTWGNNEYGQLGTGATTNSAVPVKIMDSVAAVSASGTLTSAIKTDGTLWVWGNHLYGQMGNTEGNAQGKYGAIQTSPLQVMSGVAAVSAGGSTMAAIKQDGTLWMWGENANGQLGNGGAGNTKNARGVAIHPAPVQVLDHVASVSASFINTIAVKTDGSVWIWGSDSRGQLGTGGVGNAKNSYDGVCQNTPVQLPGLVCKPSTVSAVGTGEVPPVPPVPTVPPQTKPDAGHTFPDVQPSAWYYDTVMDMVRMGAVNGFPDGSFGPERPISMAEFCKIAIGVLPSGEGINYYGLDVEASRQELKEENGDYWANEIILESHLRGVGGLGFTQNIWSQPMKRDVMTYALASLYENSVEHPKVVGKSAATALIGDYVSAGIKGGDFEACIAWAYGEGLVGGVNANGDFNPNGTVSRAEACTIISRLIHPEKRLSVDLSGAKRQSGEPAQNGTASNQVGNGTDFTGKIRTRNAQDVAYDYCRSLENEIGIQIFYLPEFTEKERGLVHYAQFNDIPLDQSYFELVLNELKKMKAAYDLYPNGFLKEMISKKNANRSAEIILCPYTYEGVTCHGMHVYDESDAAKKVDQIYYTGIGDSKYYSHEMGHMVMSCAAILGGWNKVCSDWETLNAKGEAGSYVSVYAVTSRAEDWAETWCNLWHDTGRVTGLINGGNYATLREKVRYMTSLLDSCYDTIESSQLPWAHSI